MNIRDVVLQEQNQKLGREAQHAGYSHVVRGNSNHDGFFAKAAGSVSANFGNMEVPVTPTQRFREEGSGNYSEHQADDFLADTMQAKEDAGQNLSILTGEDYKQLEEEESALEKYQESSLDRAVERIRAERQWKAERQEENKELRQQMQEELERIQAGGFLSEKGEAQIREALEQANLPVTQDIVEQVLSGLKMGMEAENITDAAKVYLVGNGFPASIDAIYHGMYSGSEGISAEMVPEEKWDEYSVQVQKILEEIGATDGESMENAKWLFANELPITAENLARVQELNDLADGLPLERILYGIIDTLSQGKQVGETILGDRSLQDARELVEQIAQIEPEDVQAVVAEKAAADAADDDAAAQEQAQKQNSAITIQELMDAHKSEQENIPIASEPAEDLQLQEITAWRQLEEIRLHMTVSSVLSMRAQGITVETESLQELISRLRAIEEEYYSRQAADAGQEVKAEQVSLMRESLNAVREIADAPARMLGTSLRQHELMTVRELHSAAVSAARSAWQYRQDYEAVGTQVRPDLGDSVKKAFANIPDLLKDLGLEDTQANERAVRILGYNEMEITEDNVQEMKQWDAQVNRLIQLMKPSTVLEMIRKGENPLDNTVAELNAKLEQEAYSEEAEEESYSRYLWQLEKSDAISQEERNGYIGIYRLLNQIEKSDGAAIGALLQSGREMTLGNLLTEVRSRKKQGMDARVDDANGARESEGYRNSITEQIETAFYRQKAGEALECLTPAKIQEVTGGAAQELLGHSLERVVEEMQDAEGAPELLNEYYEEQAEQLRDTLAQAETAKEFLEGAALPETVENIQAAEKLLQDGPVVKKLYDRRHTLSEEEREELEELLADVPDSVDSREELTEKCQKAEQFMEELLAKSAESADITYSERQEIKGMRQILHLQNSLTRSQSYEIPLQTGDSITCMNLTIREDADNAGKVQVSVQEPVNISMELRIQDGQVKGLVLCDDRSCFEALRTMDEPLKNEVERLGCSVKTISYGMDFRMQNEPVKPEAKQEHADTKILYQAAKVMVRHVSNAVKTLEG